MPGKQIRKRLDNYYYEKCELLQRIGISTQSFLSVSQMNMFPYESEESDVWLLPIELSFQKGLFLRTYWFLESIRSGGFTIPQHIRGLPERNFCLLIASFWLDDHYGLLIFAWKSIKSLVTNKLTYQFHLVFPTCFPFLLAFYGSNYGFTALMNSCSFL